MPRSLILLLRRRRFWLVLLLTVWLLCSGQALAAGSLTLSLGDRLARFPNWGSKPALPAARGDLVYPDWLRGDWLLTSTLVDLAAPLAPDLVTPGFDGNRDSLGLPVTCPVRFGAVLGRSQGLVPLLTGASVTVADRAFNGLSLARAYLGQGVVKAVKVDPHNPNRQVTLLKGNRQLESTITARATETPAPDQFTTIERFQQVFRGGAIPYFNEVETITAYRLGQRGITADQVTAVYLSPQDADFLRAQNQPVALYRYQLNLDPAEEP